MNNMNNNSKDITILGKKRKVSVLAFIGCLLLAFVIWTYVMNVKITDNRQTFNVKIDVQNQTEFDIFGYPDSIVTITVQGSNVNLSRYSEKDFKAYIDLSGIEEPGKYDLDVIVDSSKAPNVTVVSQNIGHVTVFVDFIEEKSIDISPSFAEGLDYSNDSLQINVSKISIKGPMTYIDDITYAKLVLKNMNFDSSGKGDSANNYDIVFYDSGNNVVEAFFVDVQDKADISYTVDVIDVFESTDEQTIEANN